MKISNLEKLDLNPAELGILILINSNTTKAKTIHEQLDSWLFEEKDGLLEKFEDRGLVEYVKTGKTQSQKIRISQKGKDYLKALTTSEISPLAERAWEILEELYIAVDLKNKVVNKSKTTFYIQEFLNDREASGKNYDEAMIKAVIKAYVLSFEDDKRMYMKNTLNLFFDNGNAFAKKWKAEECPILDFINNNGKEITKVYQTLK